MTDYSGTKPLVPDQLLPPGVKDERQLGFVRALDSGLKTIDIQTFIMSDADTVDAKLLPFLVREFSLQEFISTDLPDQFVRRFIKHAYELHAKKGYVEGTRLGLRMLGVEVRWVQWWQETPKAEHNTHVVTAYANENIFAGQETLLNEKVQKACLKIIDATKRWSQDITFRLGAGYKNKAGVGTAFAALTIDHETIKAGRNTCFQDQIGAGNSLAALGIQHKTIEADRKRSIRSRLGVGSAFSGLQIMHVQFAA